jgi:hypothetical protein
MIIGFTMVERKQCCKEIEIIYKGKTQICIFKFECLWSDSRKLGSDTTR